jgi:hypothetical protein
VGIIIACSRRNTSFMNLKNGKKKEEGLLMRKGLAIKEA